MKQPLVFLPTSLCAAGTTASESDLNELFQTCELLLTVRSKPMQLPTLLRKWKRDSWMRVLFSRTSSSFRIENYVTKLPSSVQGSLANHSVVQENDKQQKTHDTCGLGSQMELQLCDHDMSSLKMSKESSQLKQQTENRYLNMSSETWKKEVTRVRGEYSVRLKSEHHTKENECSSLGSYPTPRTSDAIGASQSKIKRVQKGTMPAGKAQLREWVQPNWATPQASDHVEGARTATESNQKCLGRDLARLDGPQDPVSNSTSGKNQGSWPTARTSDAEGGRIATEQTEEGFRSKRNKSNQWFGAKLRDAAEMEKPPSMKLNPAWVCQLMGLPSGWTNLGCWATE